MKIVDYVKQLLSVLTRTRLQEDITNLIKIEKEAVIPACEQVSSELGSKFSHPALKKLDEEARRVLRSVKGLKGSILDIVVSANTNAVEILEYLYELTETKMGDKIVRDGITYHKANLLQYVEAIRFLGDYSLRFARWAVVCETVAKHKDTSEAPEQVFSPADLKWLENNLEAFYTALGLACIDLETVKTGFDNMPEIVVNENSDDVATATVGISKLDPFNLQGFMPTKNPLYWVQMRLAMAAFDRFQARLEERQAIEMRLLDLRDKQKREPNPKTEEAIAYHERRLAKLEAKIRDEEKKYA